MSWGHRGPQRADPALPGTVGDAGQGLRAVWSLPNHACLGRRSRTQSCQWDTNAGRDTSRAVSMRGVHQGGYSPTDSWRLLGSGVLCSRSDWLEVWKRTSPGHDVCPQGTCTTAMGTWAEPDGICVTDKKEGSWGLRCPQLRLFMFPPPHLSRNHCTIQGSETTRPTAAPSCPPFPSLT